MKRWSFFVYGTGCHLLFFGVYAYMAGFIGGFLTPTSIDSAAAGSSAAAVAIDVLLLGLFAAQHWSWPAGIQAGLTRVVPPPIERSTTIVSCLVTIFSCGSGGALIRSSGMQQPVLRAV